MTHEHRAEDRVEPGEDVGPDDLAEACGWCARRCRWSAPRATRSCTSAAVSPVGVDGGCASTASTRERCYGRLDSTRNELDLAGVVVLEHAEAAELGEPRPALVGTRSRSARRRPASSHRARAAGRRSARRAGSRAGRSRSRARAAPRRACGRRGTSPATTGTRTITSSLSPSAIARTGCISSFSSTSHTICWAASPISSAAPPRCSSPRSGDGSTCSGRAAQHPHLEALPHLVEPVLEVAHLGGEALVVEQQRRVREPDRDLGDVLHLDEHVDGAVEVGGSRDRRRCPAGATRARRRARAARRCRPAGRAG